MKKQNYTVEWSKDESNGENLCIMAFDNNIEDNDKTIAYFGFDNFSYTVIGKNINDNPLDYKEYPILDDWQKAVENRIGCSIDWGKLEEIGTMNF